QLAFEVGYVIYVARAADFLMEDLRVGDLVGVNAVTAHADGAEFFVANGDWRGRAPALIGFDTRREIVDIRLEGGLEGFVPVQDGGEDGQRLRGERVQAGREDVSDAAFVDEDGHLGLANGEFAAVLDLHVLHGVTVGQYAVIRFGPLDDIDELF